MEAIDYELKCGSCGRIVWITLASNGTTHQWPVGLKCAECIPVDAVYAPRVVRLKKAVV